MKAPNRSLWFCGIASLRYPNSSLTQFQQPSWRHGGTATFTPSKGERECWKLLSLQVTILTAHCTMKWFKKKHLIDIHLQKSRISFHQITSPAVAKAHCKNQRRPHVGIEDRTPFPEFQLHLKRGSYLKMGEEISATLEYENPWTVHHHVCHGQKSLYWGWETSHL